MSLLLVRATGDIERNDDFHIARLLLLMGAASGRARKPVQGITKLAKMDFLLRYPNCLVRTIEALGKRVDTAALPEQEKNTIEAKMIRFRYGPWDKRYRRWIGIMCAKGLVDTYLEGRTVQVRMTEQGVALAQRFGEIDEFRDIATRSRLVVSSVGNFSGTKLKDFIYRVFPEILEMKWGEDIRL